MGVPESVLLKRIPVLGYRVPYGAIMANHPSISPLTNAGPYKGLVVTSAYHYFGGAPVGGGGMVLLTSSWGLGGAGDALLRALGR